MPITSSAKRKTRQQKIIASQRRPVIEPVGVPAAAGQTPGVRSATDEYSYVLHDLRHIAWITLVSLILLVIATILLSDFSWFVSLRSLLHLPTVTL